MRLELPFFSSAHDESNANHVDIHRNSPPIIQVAPAPEEEEEEEDAAMSHLPRHRPPPRPRPAGSSSPAVASSSSPMKSSPSKQQPSPSEAAYLCVKASLAEELDTQEELLAALTIAGQIGCKKKIH